MQETDVTINDQGQQNNDLNSNQTNNNQTASNANLNPQSHSATMYLNTTQTSHECNRIYTILVILAIFYVSKNLLLTLKYDFNRPTELYIVVTTVYWMLRFIILIVRNNDPLQQYSALEKVESVLFLVYVVCSPVLFWFGFVLKQEVEDNKKLKDSNDNLLPDVAEFFNFEMNMECLHMLLLSIILLLVCVLLASKLYRMIHKRAVKNDVVLWIEQNSRRYMAQKDLLDTGDNCGICYEDYTEESQVVTMQCKHSFHPHCLESWFKTDNMDMKCPFCRKSYYDDIVRNGGNYNNGSYNNNHVFIYEEEGGDVNVTTGNNESMINNTNVINDTVSLDINGSNYQDQDGYNVDDNHSNYNPQSLNSNLGNNEFVI